MTQSLELHQPKTMHVYVVIHAAGIPLCKKIADRTNRVRFRHDNVLQKLLIFELKMSGTSHWVATYPSTSILPRHFVNMFLRQFLSILSSYYLYVSGHLRSAAVNVRNHVGIPSCLTIAFRSVNVRSQ